MVRIIILGCVQDQRNNVEIVRMSDNDDDGRSESMDCDKIRK